MCTRSKAWRMIASPSEVYPAGKLQWHFNYGFHFRNSLWLAFAAGFAVLRGLLIVTVGTMDSFWPGDNPFRAVEGLMGGIQGRGLGARVCLAFQGLSCWEASVTLYLSFPFYTWSMTGICSWFCSPEGVINDSCENYGFFLTWGWPFQDCGGWLAGCV